MPFVRLVRKNAGPSKANKKLPCYKCGKEIELGAVYHTKRKHSRCRPKPTKHLCVPCYQNLFIDI